MTNLNTAAVQVFVTSFAEGLSAIQSVRDAVFIQEQGIDAREEYDDRDPLCQHVVVLLDGEPAGTGRLDVEQQGRLGRIAVLATHRHRGLGSRIVIELENLAIKSGLHEAWFHAQVAAVEFYQRLGYKCEGAEFMEAGIPHIRMRKQLHFTP